jgi:hypothetical protein
MRHLDPSSTDTMIPEQVQKLDWYVDSGSKSAISQNRRIDRNSHRQKPNTGGIWGTTFDCGHKAPELRHLSAGEDGHGSFSPFLAGSFGDLEIIEKRHDTLVQIPPNFTGKLPVIEAILEP